MALTPVILSAAGRLLRVEAKGQLAGGCGDIPCNCGCGDLIPDIIQSLPMNNMIFTQRLQLIALELDQLELVLQNMDAFERSANITVTRSFLTEQVQRAIWMKIKKMRKADVSQHDWFTYWLIVVRQENAGVGMLGFKGFPNETGATEIGYGLAPDYQGKGYMGEAVQGLVDWAFAHPFCSTITATEVENPASRRLLEKLGANLVRASERSTSWEIYKAQ
jgi:[ribosomal protein S5]-alanine N-acetyltransferase